MGLQSSGGLHVVIFVHVSGETFTAYTEPPYLRQRYTCCNSHCSLLLNTIWLKSIYIGWVFRIFPPSRSCSFKGWIWCAVLWASSGMFVHQWKRWKCDWLVVRVRSGSAKPGAVCLSAAASLQSLVKSAPLLHTDRLFSRLFSRFFSSRCYPKRRAGASISGSLGQTTERVG